MKRLLVFSNSKDATVDVVVNGLSNEIEVLRYNTDEEISHSIEVDSNGRNSLESVNLIWYRRPFEHFDHVENDLESKIWRQENEEMIWCYLLQYSESIWINYPSKNWYAERKLIQLKSAPKFGLLTPDWLISSNNASISEFISKHSGKCLVKPIDNGYILHEKGLSHIYSTKISNEIDFSCASNCPTLFQKIIEDKFDVRTIYVDGKVLYIRMESDDLDIRSNEMKNVKYSIISAPSHIHEAYCNFIESFGLRFSTSDFVVDHNGNWYFLENNPNGNWAWIEEYFPGKIIKHFEKSLKFGELNV